ncbi:hypothetical protein [uncultured Kordia sp.]|uniref:hypothetical protein n=1 Tax=uncultured Kordia sp. TaxID=507699 RepID=UPI002632FB37|nr:hypothetical protein [uncultured Kordia sp.]
MQGIPVPVKNIRIYKYFKPTEPIEELIIEGATGTYTVGTLTTNIFYNLDLNDDGKRVNPLYVHERYYATFETEDGKPMTTVWMFCLDNSDTPRFGRTIHVLAQNDATPQVATPAIVDSSDYIKLTPLHNITVSQLFPPPAIGQRVLIENGTGNIIGTRIGAPHLMGVEVDSGERFGELIPGMKRIIISGYTDKGELVTRDHLTVISGGQPAIFLRTFPQ